MSSNSFLGGRFRAYLQFVTAVFYYFIARALARHASEGFANQLWSPLVGQIMLAFLLLVGYSVMGFIFQQQLHPIREQGLPRRKGFPREFGMGLATGWGIAIVCVLPMALAGGIAIIFSWHAFEWGWFFADAAFFLAATLVEEIAFRGYAFQRFIDAAGSAGAVVGLGFYYAIVQTLAPGSSRVSFVVSFVLALLLATAYLRTRALWVGWGLNFGWKASRALLFGLTVNGVSSHSSVVEGNPLGIYWLTGGGFGLDGTWIAFVVLLAAIPVVLRLTRDLDFRYNAPVIVPAGIPVDLSAAAQAQHAAATGTSPESLIQIAPAPAAAQPPENTFGGISRS